MPEMMNFGEISSPVKKVLEITSFAGIDLSSAPADIDSSRSPDAPNMMPDSKGNPIKRTGFSVLQNLGARINGAFILGEHRIIHAGTELFSDGELIWQGMADELSTGQILNGKLYIFDGQSGTVCDGESAWELSSDAYIPTVLISKNADSAEKETVLKGDGTSIEFVLEQEPEEVVSVTASDLSTKYTHENGKIIFTEAPADGTEIVIKARYAMEPGGSTKEEFNLISPRWKESFLCSTGTETSFTLSQKGLCDAQIKAWVMDGNGEWQEKTENTDFTADRENGKIVFNEPILKTPITGEDNLIIEAEKFFDGYENRIGFCRQSIAFDSGGTATRIFLSGNPDEPTKDFWCAAGDPTYWPDTYYSEMGGKIIGYSVIGDRLATYISDPKDGRSVAIRKPSLDEAGNASFPVEKYLQGEAATAPKGFVFMDSEQLFVTARGVYALTTEDISGEKYTQNRSYFVNKQLCKENLADAFCAKWKQFFVLSAGRKLYLLDTSRKSYQRGEPQSTFQYECYLWDGFFARILWEEDGKLFFGDGAGNICSFTENLYSDNGKAIKAFWTIPDFAGGTFWRNKTIRIVALEIAPYAQNKVRLEYKREGFWDVLKEWTDKITFFRWDAINWGHFAWSGNSDPRTLTLKTKIKKFDKVGFRIVCDEADRAFGLYGFSVEYTESGRFKK